MELAGPGIKPIPPLHHRFIATAQSVLETRRKSLISPRNNAKITHAFIVFSHG